MPDHAGVRSDDVPAARRTGAAVNVNIDDAVELWHASPENGMQLHEFLGMDWVEYCEWVETGWLREGWQLPDHRVE